MTLCDLRLDQIRTDPRCQGRVRLREDTAEEYADVLREGGTLPPVMVFLIAGVYWLAAGFHRLRAHVLANCETILCEVRTATNIREAILFALGSNAKQGLRPEPEDNQRAVEILLDDPEWAKWSNAEISRRICGRESLRGLVSKVKAERAAAAKAETGASRTNGRIGVHQPTTVEARRGDQVYTMQLPLPHDTSPQTGEGESEGKRGRENYDLEDARAALELAAGCLERQGYASEVEVLRKMLSRLPEG